MFSKKIIIVLNVLLLMVLTILSSPFSTGAQTKTEKDQLTARTIQDSIKKESLDILPDTENLTTGFEGFEYVPLDSQPQLIKEGIPEYPAVARKKKISGTVILVVLIDKNGKVKNAKVYKSSDKNVGFEEAAIKAAYKNLYRPAIQKNKPIAVWILCPVKFELPKTSSTKK